MTSRRTGRRFVIAFRPDAFSFLSFLPSERARRARSLGADPKFPSRQRARAALPSGVYLEIAIRRRDFTLRVILRMTSFVFGTALPYTSYLQRGSLSSAREVEWAADIASLLGSSLPPPDWPVLSRPLGQIDWDRSEQLLDDPAFNLPLSAPKITASTADETWAAEQFDLARDALRRGRAHEAFTAIQKAITGDESHAGQRHAFRAHFLLGMLRLGSFQHHDAALLELDQAEQAFATSGQQALAEFPRAAGRAYLAAGWSSYCQGRTDTAEQHTQQAITADPTLAEAHFQRAKIALHRQQPDVARPFLAQAIHLNPALAEAALRDGDFLSFTPVVVEVVKSIRDAMGRRGSKGLHDLDRRAAAVNVDSNDPLPGSGTATNQSITALIVLLRAAQTALAENTLYGNVRTLAAVEAASGAVTVLRDQVNGERTHAADAVQRGTEELARLKAINIGGYALNASADDEFAVIQARLDAATKQLARATLEGYGASQFESAQAMDLLRRALDGYLESALDQATAEYKAIEQKIDAARRQANESGGAVKGFALVGVLVALFPAGLLDLLSMGSRAAVRWSETAMHLVIAALIGGALGGLVGKLFMGRPADPVPTDGALEQRLAAVRQTIADLQAEKPSSP